MNASKPPLPMRYQPGTGTTSNRLYYGDNLTIMRNMPTACVDLIYLDPPFNSQRNYNLIYHKLTGQPVPEQEEAFCDAWDMDPEKEDMARKMPMVLREYGVDEDLVLFWKAWIDALRHTQPRLLAYLIYMSYRLFEMRRILKPSGTLYLHCDPTASHYIKVIMDGVFGHTAFKNEIIWQRTSPKGDARRKFGEVHDVLLRYSRSDAPQFEPVYLEQNEIYQGRFSLDDNDGRGPYRLAPLDSPNPRPNLTYEYKGYAPPAKGWRVSRDVMERLDAEGRLAFPRQLTGRIARKHYLREQLGPKAGDVWTDIPPLQAVSAERLGYPTQKPIALLNRIIMASSKPDDVVFDPFAGCGTAIYAAHLTGRRWIGCDIAILSVKIVRDVLLKRYGLKEETDYLIDGVPLSVEGAQLLFDRDPRQFQHWAVEMAGGFCSTKHSGDKGIDGRIHFETPDGLKNMVVSVKGGTHVSPAVMRELRGVLEREGDSVMGGLICMAEPTKGMLQEVASAGRYHLNGGEFDRLQIRTVEQLLDARPFDTPSRVQTLGWTQQIPLPMPERR